MNKLILLMAFILCSCNETSLPALKKKEAKNVTLDLGSLGVYLENQNDSNTYTLSETYRLAGDQCNIAWVVITSKKSKVIGLNLRYKNRNVKERKCLIFSEQAQTHKKILTKIFTEYDISKLKWLRTPGMKVINPSGEWNDKIKKLSSNNAEWIDFTKNYPNHMSGKSSNALLKEELGENLDIIKEFTVLFLPMFSIELSHVEKVFTEKVNKQSVFYDAGLFEFKLVKLTK